MNVVRALMLFLCGWVTVFAATGAGAVDGRALARRIDVAGQQRMLAQRMAMAACFVMGDIDARANAGVAVEAHDMLITRQLALRVGDAGGGLEPARDPDVLRLLDGADQTIATFGPAVLQVSHSDLQSVVVAQVVDLDLPLLEQLNLTLAGIAGRVPPGAQGEALGHTIDIAGRQSVLSQKVLKEFCYVFLKVDTARQQARLVETIDLFESTLALLETGSDAQGVLPPPNSRAESRLARLRGIWERLSPILRTAVSGADLDPADLQRVAAFGDDLLRASDHVVASYVKR
ncbi:type IV pili methyl-accepting chemotaxis transducer N-terminal domain-containing protein [Pseudosulfitobacter koreensis]|uniref:Type IV pili methyl-accepting chemotaxis transducer N-terminal domain-containing protein n=1 Tax=Pseudosulfitobacter koreensis TaxID=2968472 RepID=A0ABT1YXS7_9RHOB|nr:type IV pili methyl-accepting chemotaxis transducer N-terminal domain-containing protein [Pseudosulfitobacter koreense]MCR8825685.1 type IV pili methyl-accepting chemotaxis transducer N-terminal domain-containing protein [Pseudosulfitobacter koreense]